MVSVNWRTYRDEFENLSDVLISGVTPDFSDLDRTIREICKNDPASDRTFLGAGSYLVSFLEFLFFKAEGPLSPQFGLYVGIIKLVFSSSEPLRLLMDHNAADAIGNIVLNKRGRLKFAIADHLELMSLLDWWVWFGLQPVSQRDVFMAIMKKSTILNRITALDPGLIMRLLEVFPAYQIEFCPVTLAKEDILSRQTDVRPLPSQRRYHRIYRKMILEGHDLAGVIREEEKRILPVQVKRNTFLGFLVKQLHHESCQICELVDEKHPDSLITIHHMVPLSEGGKDIARNMLVVCTHHHQEIHAGEILVRVHTLIEVRYRNDIFHIIPNNL
jgi:hypothetical protein